MLYYKCKFFFMRCRSRSFTAAYSSSTRQSCEFSHRSHFSTCPPENSAREQGGSRESAVSKFVATRRAFYAGPLEWRAFAYGRMGPFLNGRSLPISNRQMGILTIDFCCYMDVIESNMLLFKTKNESSWLVYKKWRKNRYRLMDMSHLYSFFFLSPAYP